MLDLKTYSYYTFVLRNTLQTEGIVLKESKGWILIKAIAKDYILDGYELIHKTHVRHAIRAEDELFAEDVLKASDKWINYENISDIEDLPLDTPDLFKYLMDNHIFVAIPANAEHSFDMGIIYSATSRNFSMRRLSSLGQWLDTDKQYKIADISLLSLHTDYILSLRNYLLCKLS